LSVAPTKPKGVEFKAIADAISEGKMTGRKGLSLA
jgi:hypothetical protein